jgi:hypothetical protein
MPLPDEHNREELLQELHLANERHRAAKLEWEKWLDASEFEHQEHVKAARKNLCQAEREVEAIEQRISEAFALSDESSDDKDQRPAAPGHDAGGATGGLNPPSPT